MDGRKASTVMSRSVVDLSNRVEGGKLRGGVLRGVRQDRMVMVEEGGLLARRREEIRWEASACGDDLVTLVAGGQVGRWSMEISR